MLPSLQFLEQIPQQIKSIPNKRKESKRREHYCCYLLCQKAGLRVSEAINFDLSAKVRNGLYRINKPKRKKERYVYVPKQVISELKKHHWQPQRTNRFNFYHFLRKIKKELNISPNTELTPHTLRRSFATYHAEAGLPLPLLSKMLGHQSIRTTALYWMNTYHDDGDDNDSDIADILTGKDWLKKPQKDPQPKAPKPQIIRAIPQPWEKISLLTKNWQTEQQINQNLQQQLNDKDKQITQLTNEKKTLQSDLTYLSEQNATLCQEKKHQIQQELATAKEKISQLEQELTNERKQKTTAQNNLAQEKQNNHNLTQQLQAERETNANLTQKITTHEQNHTNLQNAYQQALKDKELAQEHLNNLIQEIKKAAQQFHQWQKLNHYQQWEKERGELKAQIIHPPPWKKT